MGIIFVAVKIVLKLIYFKMRALAEAPQMHMRYNNIDYEHLMSWEHFTDYWAKVKPNLAFKQLPMLKIDGRYQIFQSIVILKFLECKAGLSMTDPIQEAKANAILRSA